MNKLLLALSVITMFACNPTKKSTGTEPIVEEVVEVIEETVTVDLSKYPLLTVTGIKERTTGYMASLTDEVGMTYTCIINPKSLKDNYIVLGRDDKVKIVGDYGESVPISILVKQIVRVD